MTDPQILRRGEWKHVSPLKAGWTFVTFGVETMPAGATLEIAADGSEHALVPLGGTAAVTAGAEQWRFGGRAGVFDGLGSCLYLPRDTAATLTAVTDLEIAVASAPATTRYRPVLVTPDDIGSEMPWGYHTTVAAHGHDLYYLNVLAGPAPKRTLQAREDPCLAPLRADWPAAGIDPRPPIVPTNPVRA
jgi:5-deoxy-D-glucuronate isomerase